MALSTWPKCQHTQMCSLLFACWESKHCRYMIHYCSRVSFYAWSRGICWLRWPSRWALPVIGFAISTLEVQSSQKPESRTSICWESQPAKLELDMCLAIYALKTKWVKRVGKKSSHILTTPITLLRRIYHSEHNHRIFICLRESTQRLLQQEHMKHRETVNMYGYGLNVAGSAARACKCIYIQVTLT